MCSYFQLHQRRDQSPQQTSVGEYGAEILSGGNVRYGNGEYSSSFCHDERKGGVAGSRILGLALGGHRITGSRRPVTVEQYNLPLHCKAVPMCNLSSIEKYIPQERQQAWGFTKKCLFDKEFIATKLQGQDWSQLVEADLTMDDINLLLEREYIQLADAQPLGFTRVFTVLEKQDSRRRLITVPDFLNTQVLHAGFVEFDIHLPNQQELVSDLGKKAPHLVISRRFTLVLNSLKRFVHCSRLCGKGSFSFP